MILWGFLKKEIIQLFRDPVMLFAIMIMPVVQVIILSQAITNEPKNLRLAIDIAPDDYLLHRVYDRAIASGWFVEIAPQKGDAIKVVQTGNADVALVPPPRGFTRSVERGAGELQVLIDATNVLRAQAIDGYIQAITVDVVRDYIKQKNPINFTMRILFNPQLDTQLFLIPAIMSMLLFMSILSLSCISIVKEKEMGTIETLISAPIKKYHIILGKILPYIGVGLVNMILIQLVGILLFDLPFRGSLLQYGLSFAAFTIPSAAAGLLLSTYTNTQQQGMLGMMMIAFLSIMMSGAMFPIENMPLVLRWITYINPLTHYTYLVRNTVLKGDDWVYFFQHTGALLAIGFVLSVWAVKRFKTTL
ncbi:MAG: ABC transporter permease [Lactobacillales bacterium]|nr:ABC transporter permease [Lactobacillales bacterium]